MDAPGQQIILYDGVCGFCNRFVQYVLKRDSRDLFRFASLQSGFGRELLVRHAKNPDDLNTMYLVLDHGKSDESLLERGRAALSVLRQLGGGSAVFAAVFGVLPNFLLNFGYMIIAKLRYRLAGRLQSCPLPTPQQRQKFIEV